MVKLTHFLDNINELQTTNNNLLNETKTLLKQYATLDELTFKSLISIYFKTFLLLSINDQYFIYCY